MSIKEETKNEIRNLLINIVMTKLEGYRPETEYMPFHFRLLGRDRYAMFSFIHSMNTTFGMSIWEQVAVILAKNAGFQAKRQYDLLGSIDPETEQLIQEIHRDLRAGKRQVNKLTEIELIRKKIKEEKSKKDPDSRVDLFVIINDEENYFDITSAKPNMKEFASLKLKLLRWTALRLSQDKNAKIFTRLAIPYNPYHPEPYQRWTLKGLYDLERREILVGEEFWNFVAVGNIYDKLLDVFQEAGEQLREEIDRSFAQFR
jgi:predicted nucleotidyltransferase